MRIILPTMEDLIVDGEEKPIKRRLTEANA